MLAAIQKKFPHLYVVSSDPENLSKESHFGHIEYKRTLLDISDNRIQTYATQMQWRVSESGKKAIYYIGVDDDGTKIGVPESDVVDTIEKLSTIVSKINGSIFQIQLQSYQGLWIIKAGIKCKCNQSFVFDL